MSGDTSGRVCRRPGRHLGAARGSGGGSRRGQGYPGERLGASGGVQGDVWDCLGMSGGASGTVWGCPGGASGVIQDTWEMDWRRLRCVLTRWGFPGEHQRASRCPLIRSMMPRGSCQNLPDLESDSKLQIKSRMGGSPRKSEKTHEVDQESSLKDLQTPPF